MGGNWAIVSTPFFSFRMTYQLVISLDSKCSSNLPFSVASLPAVSLIRGQLLSKNIKGQIPEVIHVLNCTAVLSSGRTLTVTAQSCVSCRADLAVGGSVSVPQCCAQVSISHTAPNAGVLLWLGLGCSLKGQCQSLGPHLGCMGRW